MSRSSWAAALALAFCLLASFDHASAQQATFQPGPIFPADAKLESVFSGGFFLEGPAAAADGTVHFSDITITDVRRQPYRDPSFWGQYALFGPL
jgi:hypothetical protein